MQQHLAIYITCVTSIFLRLILLLILLLRAFSFAPTFIMRIGIATLDDSSSLLSNALGGKLMHPRH